MLAWNVQTVCLGCRMSYFILLVLQTNLSTVGSSFTINNNASKENNRIISTASSQRSCQRIENETAADEGKARGAERGW